MMDQSPTSLSVLTISRGRNHHLLQLFEGLRRSQYPPAELVIVDMNPDRTLLPPAPFLVRIIHRPSPENAIPLAMARNLAAAQARFDNLLFLDVDCIPTRGLVSAVAAAIRSQDMLICAEVLYLAAEETRGNWTEDQLLKTALRHPLRRFPSRGFRLESNFGLFWSLAFAIRKDCFFALGGFDERFCGYGAEDTDFGLRAEKAGLPLAFMGGTAVFHQHHEIYDPPLNHWEDIVRNAQLFYSIHEKWPMKGWLDAFEAMKLIKIKDTEITVLRRPTHIEIAAACKRSTERF